MAGRHQHAVRGGSRADRVAEQIRRDLAVLVRERLKDPRVGMLTLLDVNVSKDLAHAKVWFDMLDVEQAPEVEKVLNHAAGFLRRELGKNLKTRVTPELRFFYDDTQHRGQQLSDLIDRVIAEDGAEQPSLQSNSEPDTSNDASPQRSAGSTDH